MRFRRYILLFLFITITGISAIAQEKATIYGRIIDNHKKPVDLVNITVLGYAEGTITDKDGNYKLDVPANKKITIIISFIGYEKEEIKIYLKPGERRKIDKTIKPSITELSSFTVEDKQIRNTNIMRINPKQAWVIPSISGSGIENLIKTLPGVSSNNELSSQYSVRGGNYDENLVYVNDIEIYRPFLIRSGQQEGLSFINSYLVSSISFSAGGFDAKYGDKMSSVLDIKYKKPKKFKSSISMSLLGGSAHIEGATNNHRFSYLIGARQKSNQYVLNSLETKGEYRPSFSDIQSLLRYEINERLEISVLGYYARNKYNFIPETRETSFGTINQAYKLKIYFDGQELDEFKNYLGAFTSTFKPRKNIKLKLITSTFETNENESFDTQGQYWIGELETGLGNDEFGKAIESKGIGTHLNHTRNYFKARVYNIEHLGTYEKSHIYLQWGLKYQRELINDEMNEWEMMDSAGYSLPHPPDSVGYTNPTIQPHPDFNLNNFVSAKHNISSNRYSGFIQNRWNLDGDSTKYTLTAGLRANYWDFNKQFLISPRATLSYKPNWKKDIIFRLSTGYYYQPPFYRELRDKNGNINHNLKAQKSIHFVVSSDWNLKIWGRPFKYVTEIYYKYLDDLVPYEIDNVKICYYAKNDSHGYATGIDMKINGDFVTGIESWASLSIMQTKEDIKDDFYYDKNGIRHEPGYIPRPTDQRINFSMFFQDYLPKAPSYKMYLNFLYGSGLPFGPPNSPKYKHIFRSPSYLRVDIGFSKQLICENTKFNHNNIFRHFKSLWLSAEVFNLLDKENTISYLWISDISNRQYAVPNFLTSRRLNLKLIAKF